MAYGLQDLVQLRQWIAKSEGLESYKQVQRQKLDALIGLCEMVTCRRQALLAYFGEHGAEPCGNCDNCLSPPETIDGTMLAQKALSAVYRTGQGFGVNYVVDVLTGKADDRVGRNGHDRLAVFGIGKDVPATEWRGLFRQLVAAGHLAADGEGYGTLQLTERARPLLRGEESFRMRKASVLEGRSRREKKPRSGSASPGVAAGDAALLAALKALRLRLATEAGVPPYVICHDRTLLELAARRPQSEAALHDISGFGDVKVRRYGAAIIATIAQHRRHPLLDNRLSASVNQTLSLHLEGRTPAEIAAARNIEENTVLGHFAEAIEAGLIEAKAVVPLDGAEIDEIHAAFERCQTLETGKLGPAHAALDGRYDYGVLRCVLAELA
jgi:ATP-dependent DNA helicase RecQ